MSEIIKLSITVNSVIDNLDDSGLPEGDPEINIFTTDGTMTVNDRLTKLVFTETVESESITSTIYVTEDGVRLFKRGAIEADMRFSEGACEKTIYRVGPYAFDMEIKTKRIKCALDECGGELSLLYAMNVGGQEKNVKMKITAKRK